MEKHAVIPRPQSDSTALFVILYPLVGLLRWAVPALDTKWELLVCVPVLILVARAAVQLPAPALETKAARRSGRQRPPRFWGLVLRCYLYLSGEKLLHAGSMAKKPSANSCILRIRYVGSTHVGILLVEPSQLRFYVNDVPWTQVYASDEKQLAVVFGLFESTVYSLRIVHTDSNTEQRFYICTASSTANGPTDDNQAKPRRREVDVHAEGLRSVSLLLEDEKARARKHRKDSLKKLSGVRHEIDGLTTKLATKRKSDERARKRIQVLRDRVAQQKLELAELQNQASSASKMSARDVADLASKVEAIQRERHSKQQGLDVSVRVWAELQRSKSHEVEKLKQRCAKLCDRIDKIRKETAAREDARAELISSLVRQFREERSLRKQRRVRLEADFRTAIAKLESQ